MKPVEIEVELDESAIELTLETEDTVEPEEEPDGEETP